MNEVMTVQFEQAASTADTSSSGSGSIPAVVVAPPPPPPPNRRPRVREVSSRFMSPVPSSSSSSSSSSPNHKQHQRRRHQDSRDAEHSSSVDENHRPIETARSLESPFLFQRRHQHQRRSGNSLRPDTPTLMNSSSSLSSRSRVIQRSNSNGTTAATKLLQSLSAQPSNSASQDDATSTISDDTSSQISEADMLPTVSARFLAERNINRINVNVTAMAGDSSKSFSASPCLRSLNLPLSSSQHSLLSSVKGNEKATPAVSRSYTNAGKLGGFSLPPVAPPQPKPGTDARKVKKVSSHQEDIQSIKLLYNHYLQWRFANAKAEASIRAQRRETERTLYSLGVKIADLYDSVKRKRMEIGILQRSKILSTILEAQMPYLDEWCALEGDYSNSLSEVIQALVNASLQLPIGGNVRADVQEVGEALNSAMKLMETIMFHAQSFMPKAEELEMLISELAKVSGGERGLIEECGGLLSKTHAFQVEECSLRGQLMQLHKRLPPGQCQEETNNLSVSPVHMR